MLETSLKVVLQIKEQTGLGQHESRRLLFFRSSSCSSFPEGRLAPLEHGCGAQLCTKLGFASVSCSVISISVPKRCSPGYPIPASKDTGINLGIISHQLENSTELGRPEASPPADVGSVLAKQPDLGLSLLE